MPVVQIEMMEGRTLEQKRAMVKKVTEALVETLNAKPEAITIVIREMKREHYAHAGVLACDRQ